MKKWLKLKTWAKLVRRTFTYLTAPDIPAGEKALMVIPAALYWVLPDALPFFPLDDMAVTLLLSHWFLRRIENKYPHLSQENPGDR